jgi:glycosyltransferase A (GT-A) superfamily protein (DUF2064 family)
MHRVPAGPAIIIGTDVPAIRATHIAAAFRALGSCEGVLGPAADGGYWLVGLRRRPRTLRPFNNVRWSTRHALADTQANFTGHRIALLDVLADIDAGPDFLRVRSTFARRIPPVDAGTGMAVDRPANP